MSKIGFLGAVLCLVVWGARVSAQAQPTASATAAGPAAATTAAAPPPAAAAAPASATNPKTPEQFFTRARQLSDLEASGIPFHLKATYVATGDAEFTGNGTYEVWWQSESHWRRQATLGTYQYVSIQDGSKKTTYASSSYIPLRLRQVMGFSLIHINPKADASRDWALNHQKLKGTDYILLSSSFGCPFDKNPAACTTKEFFSLDGALRVEADRTFIELYNGIQSFQGLLIPREITVNYEEKPVLTISISELEPLNPNDAAVSIDAPRPAGLQSIVTPWDARSRPDYAREKLLQRVPPTYPEFAREEDAEGTVLLSVSVDDQGTVREPYVYQSAGEPTLDRAALDAVRQWKYRPATIGGVPNCAIMIVSFNFHLRY